VSQFGKVHMCIVYWTVHLVDQHIIICALLVIVNWKGCERKLLVPNVRCTVLTYFPEGFWLSFGPGTYRIKTMIDVSDLTVKLYIVFSVRLQE